MSGRRPEADGRSNELASLRLARKLLPIWVSSQTMSEPREILPNTIYQVTRRCAQQQLLMRPDDETNNAFLYCLAEAAQRFDIGVLITAAMSNHHHTDIIDRQRNVSMFLERFHGMFAHCMNHLRGRSENFWSSEETSLVVLADPSAVISSVVYAATNPVKDGLVERVDEWPGVNGLSALLEQRTIVARRPSYFRADGPMPETVTLELIIPEELGDPDAFRNTIRERVAQVEKAHEDSRRQTGRSVMGRTRILRESWRSYPASATREHRPRSRDKIKPRFATRDEERRIELIVRRQVFLRDYRAARLAWLAGTPIPFPPGTYWLRRFVGVPVACVSN